MSRPEFMLIIAMKCLHKESGQVFLLMGFFFFFFFFCYAGSSLLRGLFFSCIKWGLLSSCRAWALEYMDFSNCGMWISSCSSRALEHRLNCCGVPGLSSSTACGIFPDQGSNLCLLHFQADSLLLKHQKTLLMGFWVCSPYQYSVIAFSKAY